jgi:hypothetical protein
LAVAGSVQPVARFAWGSKICMESRQISILPCQIRWRGGISSYYSPKPPKVPPTKPAPPASEMAGDKPDLWHGGWGLVLCCSCFVQAVKGSRSSMCDPRLRSNRATVVKLGLGSSSSMLWEAQGLGESRRKPCTTLSVLSTATPSGAANLLGGVVVAFSNLASLRYLQVKF